jgi:hypothetical protein
MRMAPKAPLVMTRTISSSQTFLVKFVFPVLWCTVFGAVTIGMGTGFFPGVRLPVLPPAMVWIFVIVWIAGAASWWWWGGQWKKVRLDETALYISNFRKEIRVPLTEIEEVTQNRWIKGQPVTIRFRTETGFGTRITFMPKVRMLGFWRTHPIVAQLQNLALSARA